MTPWLLGSILALIFVWLAILTGQIQECLRRLDASRAEGGFLESSNETEAFIHQIARLTDAKNADLRVLVISEQKKTITALQEWEGANQLYQKGVEQTLNRLTKQQGETQNLLKGVAVRLTELETSFQNWEAEYHKVLEPTLPIKSEAPSEDEFQNGSDDWQKGIACVQGILQNTSDTGLQLLLTQLQEGYETLVTDWKRFETTSPLRWSTSDIRNLDFALYFAFITPPIMKGDSQDQSVLKKTAVAITLLQQLRRDSLKGRGVERLEGVPGVTEQIAGEIEHDSKTSLAIPEKPEQGGKLCRIEPGMGGYRFQGKVFRRTLAIFYRAYRLS